MHWRYQIEIHLITIRVVDPTLSLRAEISKVLDCGLDVREFQLRSRYYVPVGTNILRKGINPFIPQLWLHSITAVDMPLNKETEPIVYEWVWINSLYINICKQNLEYSWCLQFDAKSYLYMYIFICIYLYMYIIYTSISNILFIHVYQIYMI